MKNSSFAILGGSGFAIEVLDYLRDAECEVVGYYSPTENQFLSSVIPWLKNESVKPNRDWSYIVASGTPKIRQKMIQYIREHSLHAPALISPFAYVAKSATVGTGSIIGPLACVTGNAIIGEFCILNTHASVHHDCKLGENVVLAPGARMAGFCQAGDNCLINLNASVIPKVSLGTGVELGVHSYASRNVDEHSTLFTPPSRLLPRSS